MVFIHAGDATSSRARTGRGLLCCRPHGTRSGENPTAVIREKSAAATWVNPKTDSENGVETPPGDTGSGEKPFGDGLRVWHNGSACATVGGPHRPASRVRNPSSFRRNPRRSRYTVSKANGSRSFSAAALSESPASTSTSQRHTSEAVNVCRGKTSARTSENVRPQPPRRPRLEQNTRWPRNDWPLARKGSLPTERLCRFSVSTFPQRGQRCCLSEKASPSTHRCRAQNEKANGTSTLVA